MEFNKQISRRTVLVVSGTSIASVLLTSCTVGGASKPTAKKAAELHAAFTTPLNSLDPYLAGTTVDPISLMSRGLIFDTLVRTEGKSSKLVGSLAKSWEQPNDTTWVFHLRDNVTFHDGTKLSATDVKAAMDFMTTHPTEQSPLWAPISKVEATDAKTVTVTTKTRMGSMLVNLPLLFIAKAADVGNTAAFSKPVGSGTYTVSSFVPSSKLELTRAKSYWGTPGKSKKIDLPYISETSSAVTSLLNGQMDLLWPVSPDQVSQLEGAKGVKVERAPSWTYYFNWFNCGRKPFTDARVRQALWYALDIKSIVHDLFGTSAEPMKAPIPSTVFGYAPQHAYSYDPDKARSLLKEAGLPNGFSTSVMWSVNGGPSVDLFAQALISGWSKIGVKVKPVKLELAQWVSKLNTLDWDMDLQTNNVSTGDAEFTIGRLYTSAANRMAYKNPALDKILAEASAQTAGSAKRKDLYGQACKIIWDEAVGIFPASLISTYGVRDNVSGFTPSPSNQPNLAPVSVSA